MLKDLIFLIAIVGIIGLVMALSAFFQKKPPEKAPEDNPKETEK